MGFLSMARVGRARERVLEWGERSEEAGLRAKRRECNARLSMGSGLGLLSTRQAHFAALSKWWSMARPDPCRGFCGLGSTGVQRRYVHLTRQITTVRPAPLLPHLAFACSVGATEPCERCGHVQRGCAASWSNPPYAPLCSTLL